MQIKSTNFSEKIIKREFILNNYLLCIFKILVHHSGLLQHNNTPLMIMNKISNDTKIITTVKTVTKLLKHMPTALEEDEDSDTSFEELQDDVNDKDKIYSLHFIILLLMESIHMQKKKIFLLINVLLQIFLQKDPQYSQVLSGGI